MKQYSYRMTVELTRPLSTIPAFSRSSAWRGSQRDNTHKRTRIALLRTVLSLSCCSDFCRHFLLSAIHSNSIHCFFFFFFFITYANNVKRSISISRYSISAIVRIPLRYPSHVLWSDMEALSFLSGGGIASSAKYFDIR